MPVSRSPDFSDLDLDFIAHPTTKRLVRKTGVDAIKRSVRNLVFTNYYDRPFRSYIGSNVRKLLFENMNPLTAGFLKDAINEVIELYEPRVRVVEIKVDTDYDNNTINVNIAFIIVNTGQPANVSLILERIR